MEKRRHKDSRIFKRILVYVLAFVMVASLMPVTIAKAEAGSDETGLYFADWDWNTKTMNRLDGNWYTEVPDKTGFVLVYATKGEADTTYQSVDMSNVHVTYCAEANDENPSSLTFGELEEGQMTECQLSENDYNSWATKEITGDAYIQDATLPVAWYNFNEIGTYKFTYTVGEIEYSCYLYRYNRAWDFYETNVVTDNPLRDYYYQEITADTGFYLNQADAEISLGKLTYREDGSVVIDDAGNPVLDESGPVIAARFQWNDENQQDEVVGVYSDCISYNSGTGKISILANPTDDSPDYTVRVYFYVKETYEEDGQPVTNYRQESTDIQVHHGEDLSNAIWLGYDDWNGAVSWKLQSSDEESLTVLTPYQSLVGQVGGVYDVYLTEKPQYPEDFDWGNVTEEENNKYGWRAGAEPVVIVRSNGHENTYRVNAEESAYRIDNCTDEDNNTWHFTYTYQAGDNIEIFWSDYDAFAYDDTTQFQIEMGVQSGDNGGSISLSPTPAEADSFKHETYGEKYNFDVSQLEQGVTLTFTPSGDNDLEEFRIGDTRYVNATLNSESSDPTFTPNDDGSFTYTLKEEDVQAYHWEPDPDDENNMIKVPDTDENGNPRYGCIYVEARFRGSDPEEPDPGSEMSNDFAVKIGDKIVYNVAVAEGDPKIPDLESEPYDVEEIDGGIAIKPKQGTDQSDPDVDISDKKSLTLDPISVTGNGRVEVHAGLNYTPENAVEGSHIEEDVPIIIKASATTGYSFEADGDVDFLICWGNFRSTATLEGGVKARSFTLNDMAKLTIGSADSPVKEAFCAPLRDGSQMYESSSVEFNLAEVEIYANKGFTNYKELRAWDEANVTLSVENAKMFDNVNTMQVQTGGKFTLKSISVIEYPQGFKAQAGYYNEIGEILNIQNDGRFQDAVNIVDCVEGDHSEAAGRYIYSINEDNTEITLESTSKTLWPLGYSFRADSGDQYVEHGHFEISAGSGLCREGMTDGGEYWFEEGTEVTFKLVPDTGYQYKEGTFKFNGDASENVVRATDEPGVYIFTMPSNPIHVSCVFEEVEDEIDVEASEKVAGADIVVPDGAICGTAEFSVKDTTLTPEQNTAFESVAGDKTLGATLDLSMNEVINKIGTEGAWVTQVHDLKTAMDVSLKLDDSLAGQSEYVVIREHNGVTEALETQYDAATNSVNFATNGYSTYAIAYKKPATPEPPAHVHAGTKVAAVAATCVTAGNSEYYTCTCGKYFSDADCTKEIVKDSWVIPATGHKWDNGTVTKEVTATEAGVKTYHCTNTGCTETKTEAIPATGVPEKGTEIKDDKGTASYKVTGSDAQNPTVTYTETKDSKAKTVTIPATVTVDGVTYKVTAIADGAFKGNKNITKVTIPKNVTTIGANAFNGCTKLSTVTIGSSVTSIGANAFKDCKVLTKVTIPSKVTTIGSNAFNGCTKLKTVTVGSNVTSVGANAFKGCKTLTKITLPGKTNKIGANAFNGCSKLKTITIKSKKMTSNTISKNAFKGISSKATIKVPKGKAKTYKTLFQKKGLSKKVNVK